MLFPGRWQPVGRQLHPAAVNDHGRSDERMLDVSQAE
jgi:hypothetical protein